MRNNYAGGKYIGQSLRPVKETNSRETSLVLTDYISILVTIADCGGGEAYPAGTGENRKGGCGSTKKSGTAPSETFRKDER